MEWVLTMWCDCITDDRKPKVLRPKPEHLPYKFRLLDDDGNVFGYGYASENDTEAAFEPLDYYEPRYGCTEIQYRNGGKWETL